MTRPLDDQVAGLLEAGATYAQIRKQLQVSNGTIRRVRIERHVALPPGRAKRTRAQIDEAEQQALTMLHDGATVEQIYKTTRISLNVIARLRRDAGLPRPTYNNPTQRLTLDEAFTRYALPTTEGDHLLWTGPHSGRSLDLLAEGRRYNARHIGFRKHHGRDPEGRVWRTRTCDLPDCIAGAHHTDQLIRQANTRADHLFNAIFGTGDTT